MNPTKASISNPVAVIAAVLLVLLMGAIGLSSLPIQMIPDIQRPFIQINTGWRTAAPEEVESEILEPQEDMLRGLPGLEKMESNASRGRATISLIGPHKATRRDLSRVRSPTSRDLAAQD